MIPPVFIRVRRTVGGERRRGVWLPLVLLWPVVIPLFIFAAAVAAVVGILMLPFGPRRAWRVMSFLPRVWALVSALRGLRVRASGPGQEIDVGVW